MFLIGLAIVGSIGVFAYERYLTGVAERKAQEVAAAEAQVNPDTVEAFIRTRDRFTAAKDILDNHVAASQFFDLLESVTLQSVRFNGLSFLLAADRSAEIRMTGVATTFNALAAQSSAFATEKRIKSAIFSDIAVGPGGTVSFSLEADVDPRLLALSDTPPIGASSSIELPISSEEVPLDEGTFPVEDTGVIDSTSEPESIPAL